MHIDDAYDFLIQHLAAIPDLSGHAAQVERNKQYSCDLWIPNVILKYWQPRINNLTYGDLEEDHFRPLYDAAWELCRIGILRPGQFASETLTVLDISPPSARFRKTGTCAALFSPAFP